MCPCVCACVRVHKHTRVPLRVTGQEENVASADAHWGIQVQLDQRGSLGSRNLPWTAWALRSLSVPGSPPQGPAAPHPELVHTDRRTWARALHPLPTHPGRPMASPDTSHKRHSVVLRLPNSARLCPEKAALGEGQAPSAPRAVQGGRRRVGGPPCSGCPCIPVGFWASNGPAAGLWRPCGSL